MATAKISPARDAGKVAALLDSPEIAALIAQLEATRWTGRPGYPVRAMIGLALVKSLYAIPTWTRAVGLVRDHAGLRKALGATPSVDSAYRFTVKLRAYDDLLAACTDRVVAAIHAKRPDFGKVVALDGSDLPAYANGMRRVSKNGPLRKRFADPDASWGHRSAVSTRAAGGYYGFKIHALVCAATDLPIAWQVEAARTSETRLVGVLLDDAARRGIRPGVALADKGYDHSVVHDLIEEHGARPVIPLRETADVKRGKAEPPSCEHGTWVFAGSDMKRKLAKWRCPSRQCTPASAWLKASRLHPLIPRESERWKALYRRRTAVERTFGRLKHDWGMLPLRVRRIARVRLHINLSILTHLASALLALRA